MTILSISENILGYIAGFGVMQGVLLAALIYFHPKADKSVNKFLASYIFVLSILMAIPFIVKVITWKNSWFIQPIPLLAGPFLYLYCRSFKEVITFKKAWPHFVLFFAYIFPTYINVSAAAAKFPNAELIPGEFLQSPFTLVLNYGRLVHAIIYFFLARNTIISYQRSIKQLFSETNAIEIKWGKLLVHGNIVIVLAGVISFTCLVTFPQHFYLFLLINMSIATPYIYLVTYKGVLQPTIWQLKNGVDKQVIENEIQVAEEIALQVEQVEKAKTCRTFDRLDEAVEKIVTLMEKDKLYQETELTLQHLADKIKIPAYQVSQAINEGLKKNFYDLINSYRVEEAKQLLLNPKNRNYTILSVGFEAGFNSKTTFNTVFKKFTGLTPTEYRDKQEMAMAV